MDGNFDGWIPINETWTYASADSPTFTFTVPGDLTNKYSPGMRIKLTQSSVAYFIITAVSYSSPNTTITVYGGTDYTLANADITFPYYSSAKAPFGFPLDPAKWTVKVVDNSSPNVNNPTVNTWYNIGNISITVPIGTWRLVYSANFGFDSGSTPQDNWAYITLSTSNNSQDDVNMTSEYGIDPSQQANNTGYKEKFINLTSKTTYYINMMAGASGLVYLYCDSTNAPIVIIAVCAYL